MNNYEPDMLRRMLVGGGQQQSMLASPYSQTPPMIQGAPPVPEGGQQGQGGMDIMQLLMSLGQMYGGSSGGGMMGGMGG